MKIIVFAILMSIVNLLDCIFDHNSYIGRDLFYPSGTLGLTFISYKKYS